MAPKPYFAETYGSPARAIRAVTPDDDTDLPDGIAKALWCTVAGDLEVMAEIDTVALTIPVTEGVIPIRTKRVLEGTTATVVALY
jgi:hypothetical protein